MSDTRPPPAFQFYAADVLANERFKLLSLEERGLWITMLAQCWVNDSVPAEESSLAKVLGLDASLVVVHLPAVLHLFKRVANRLVHSELDTLKAHYTARREERAKTGRKGAESRWNSNGRASGRAKGKPIAEPLSRPSTSANSRPERRTAEGSRGKQSEGEGGSSLSSAEDVPVFGFTVFDDWDEDRVPQ